MPSFPISRTLAPRRRTVSRSSRSWPLLCLGAFVLALGSSVAHAGDRPPTADEQRLFADGVRLLQAGDASGAAREFQAGYDAGHDPAFLVRLGEAQEKAGALPAAAESYQRYLRESPDASDRDDIAARVQRLTPGAVAAPAGDGAPGTTPAQAVSPASAPAVGAPPPGPARSPAAVPEVDEEESLRAFADENPTPHTRLNVAAWIGTGVTVALLGVAAFYGAKAGDKATDLDRLTSNFDPRTDLPAEYASVAAQYTADMRDGKRDNRLAKGFAIAAGATALTTAALFIIDAVRHTDGEDGKTHAAVAPLLTAQSAGVGLGVTF